MAENKILTDFVRWITGQVDPADLSALMSKYGYADDSQESIIDAIEKDQNFRIELGVLLRTSVEYKQREDKRSIGGVRIASNEMTIQDWIDIYNSQITNKSTGLASTAKDNKFDWTRLFGNILGVGGSVLNYFTGDRNTQSSTNNQPPQQSGQNTFLFIFIGVLVVAVIGVIWVSLRKK